MRPSVSQHCLLPFAALAAGALLVACGEQATESAVKPAAAVAVEKTALPQASSTQLDEELLAALAPAPGEVMANSAELSEEARRIMDLYPEKNAQELLSVPEVNAPLVAALKELGANEQLQAAINKSVDLAAHFKGLSGPPGSYKLNLDLKAYDPARTQRMLTAVLAGRAKPMVQFLVDEVGEASFEFTFTDAERTSNGIALEKNPQPPKPVTPTDPD